MEDGGWEKAEPEIAVATVDSVRRSRGQKLKDGRFYFSVSACQHFLS
jgi:hypothetical protein